MAKPRVFACAAAALGLVTWVSVEGAAAEASPVAHASPACTGVQTLTYSAADQAAARDYWTTARIQAAAGFSISALNRAGLAGRSSENAQPLAATQCTPTADAVTGSAASIPRVRVSAATPTATTGFPTIGKLTFKADGVLDLSCTATVIQGAKVPNNEELIATAAHCIEGTTAGIPYTSTNLAFSPMWHDNQSPLGVWTADKVFLNSGWMHCPIPLVDCSTNPADDYAIIVLNPQNGRGVGDVTGADGWLVNQPGSIAGVTIAGIPSNSPQTLVAVSDTTTVVESGTAYRQATTPGFTDGSSGGPWLEHFNSTTGVGTLIGDTGGFEQGGPASGSPSFTDTWNGAFASVVADATNFEG
jgi:hypothetical protein